MTTYRIIRLYADTDHPLHRSVGATGLTLAEAMAHCKRPESRGPLSSPGGRPLWLDGFDIEEDHATAFRSALVLLVTNASARIGSAGTVGLLLDALDGTALSHREVRDMALARFR